MKGLKGGMLSAVIIVFVLSFLTVAGAAELKQIKEYTAEVSRDNIQKVTIVGGGYYFEPNYIIVKVDVPVELTVTKEPGIVPHNIVMESPEAGMKFDEYLSITPKTITFTPSRVGKFPIFCDKKLLFFKSHREKGMEGILEVRE